MFIISNTELEDAIGEVPITDYYDNLNSVLVNTIHMMNVYNNSDPIMGTLSDTLETARLSTVGLLNLETGEKKLFYPLQTPREILYYYSIDKEQLKSDGTLLKKILNQVKESGVNDTRVSYGIYSNNYEQNYGYVSLFASLIQSEES